MNFPRTPNADIQYGFSLVEIMVALSISLLLLAGVLQIFLSSKQAYRAQENLSRVQENDRFAVDYLGRYLRLAGYRANLDKTAAERFPSGSESLNGADNDSDSSNTIADGSDTITVRFEGDGTTAMRDCLGSIIQTNEIATNVFRISTSNELTCTTPAGQKTCSAPTSGVGVCINPATQASARTETIVEGVENMQVLYGEDTDGNGVANRYVTRANVSNIDNVVTIRISLLLRTMEDNIADTPVSYTYNGATVNPGDRRLRRIATTTIALRNRLQ